jgi:hypothetical protein
VRLCKSIFVSKNIIYPPIQFQVTKNACDGSKQKASMRCMHAKRADQRHNDAPMSRRQKDLAPARRHTTQQAMHIYQKDTKNRCMYVHPLTSSIVRRETPPDNMDGHDG